MAGMDENMLAVIRALAENRIADAKQKAILCCIKDDTKKNEMCVKRYKNLLINGNVNMIELPLQLTGILNMQDVSDYREDRYYLGRLQTEVFHDIEKANNTLLKLLEYGIPYNNSTLLYGQPGTGKTEFAKYVAYKLKLPYAYVNFSNLIDSYMGKTSQNLQKIFDYCKGQKCVLMLDEIDCIGLQRGKSGGVDGELGRTTITLIQMLDTLVDGQIVIGATNREDRLDKALLRRFQRKYKFEKYDGDEELKMMLKYMNSVDSEFIDDDIYEYATKGHTQAETVNFMIKKIIEKAA